MHTCTVPLAVLLSVLLECVRMHDGKSVSETCVTEHKQAIQIITHSQSMQIDSDLMYTVLHCYCLECREPLFLLLLLKCRLMFIEAGTLAANLLLLLLLLRLFLLLSCLCGNSTSGPFIR
jgi:hypothetical protein